MEIQNETTIASSLLTAISTSLVSLVASLVSSVFDARVR